MQSSLQSTTDSPFWKAYLWPSPTTYHTIFIVDSISAFVVVGGRWASSGGEEKVSFTLIEIHLEGESRNHPTQVRGGPASREAVRRSKKSVDKKQRDCLACLRRPFHSIDRCLLRNCLQSLGRFTSKGGLKLARRLIRCRFHGIFDYYGLSFVAYEGLYVVLLQGKTL
ncbi:hypothetical protein HZ326_24044 [Fusarium oxysporum f. sp. albedinis]|nr:Cytochrome P450 monooxygenase apf7 [Fusarium oxysporum f. sp. albedinis]KAJ0132875.1 hypothetical protein HZ326_24044 [Fusarium oxysporum f. sp. albedinis]